MSQDHAEYFARSLFPSWYFVDCSSRNTGLKTFLLCCSMIFSFGLIPVECILKKRDQEMMLALHFSTSFINFFHMGVKFCFLSYHL